MYIQSTEGLALQGSGASRINYGVRNINKALSFTRSQGWTDILTITASPSTPTNFIVTFFFTFHADNTSTNGNTSGPQIMYYNNSYNLNSGGFWNFLNSNAIIGQGNAWIDSAHNLDTQRVLKLQLTATNATYPNITAMCNLLISCSDFSYLTFS